MQTTRAPDARAEESESHDAPLNADDLHITSVELNRWANEGDDRFDRSEYRR